MSELLVLNNADIHAAPLLRVSQIKVGDVLCRRNDHLGRPDADLVVERKLTKGVTIFRTRTHSLRQVTWTGKGLSAENYSIIVRDGKVVGRFMVKYW